MKWILTLSAAGGLIFPKLVLGSFPDIVTFITVEVVALPIVWVTVTTVERLTGCEVP